MPKKIKLIANPVAGGDARPEIERAKRYLEKCGCMVDLTLTGARGDAMQAAAAAKKRGFDLIIAAGGDGTLNEVVCGLAPCDIPLGFLPLGTTNVFALEVGIPFDVERACDIALECAPHKVCLGKAGDTPFLLMAGIGFDAEVVRRVNTRLKHFVGKAAYVISALTTLLHYNSDPIEIVLGDGQVKHGVGAIISNGRLYGGRFSITPDASIKEDVLDVCLFTRGGRLSMVRYAAKMALGLRLRPSEAEIFKAKEVTIRGAKGSVQIDGDYFGQLPMTFRASFGEISLVLPPDA